jgi:hypothetical protein
MTPELGQQAGTPPSLTTALASGALPRLSRVQRAVVWTALMLFGALVFSWYLNPDFVFNFSALNFCG